MDLEYRGAAAASAIIMSDVLKKKKIVLVEGSSERFLLSDLFPTLYPISAVGQDGVIDAIDGLVEEYGEDLSELSIIGFIDKDYLSVIDNKDIHTNKNIITTHFRDIEIDMLQTEILRRVLEEKGSAPKWTSHDLVLREVYSCLETLSYMRVYNHVKGKFWDFKTIDLTAYCSTKGVIDYVKLIRNFRQNNKIKQSEWDDFENWRKYNAYDLPLVTRGHDATCVIGQMLRSKIGNRDKGEASSECVEENLRLAARIDKLCDYQWVQKLDLLNNAC